MNQKLKLELTVNEINMILSALGDQPYIKVHGLIQDIRSQAEPQIQQQNDATDSLPSIAELSDTENPESVS